jgi:hypothetical protein
MVPGLYPDPKHWLKWMYLLIEEPKFAGDVKKSAEANPEYCDLCDMKYSSLSEFAMNIGVGKDRDWDPKIGRCREGGGGGVSTAKSVTTYAPSLVIELS